MHFRSVLNYKNRAIRYVNSHKVCCFFQMAVPAAER